MDIILYNDLCVRFWRVPFVVLVFTFFVFVVGSPASAACRYEEHYFGYAASSSTGICPFDCSAATPLNSAQAGLNTQWVSFVGGSASQCQNGFGYCSGNTAIGCTKRDVDSLKCVNLGDDHFWNSGSGTCDSTGFADTTYKCVNGTLGSSTYGERPVARLYRCINDVCEATGSLNGTCQDWSFCEEGQSNCDVPKDSSSTPDSPDSPNVPRVPCHRSGGSYSTSGRCYYQCVDGSSKSCKPTATEYVAGNIYAGVCPDNPPESCYPPTSSPSSVFSSSSEELSLSSSSVIVADTIDLESGDVLDYSKFLDVLVNEVKRGNEQNEVLSRWDTDFIPKSLDNLDDISQYTLNNWQDVESINNKLRTYQEDGFNLTDDVKGDLDTARLLLDEINAWLRHDSIKTYSSDTTYNPLLREIKDALDSTGSVDSTYGLLKPYFSDSGQWDSPITRAIKSITDNFPSRDSSTRSMCSAYYSCVQESGLLSGFTCKSRFPNWESCVDGGTPLDGIENLLDAGLTAIVKGLFGDDSTDIPTPSDDGDTNVVLPPIYSSASAELRSVNDSLGRFNVRSVVDSMRSMLDSAKRMNQDTTKIQPDSLWLDSSQVVQYVDHILLPSGTGTDCFVCRADLGTFGGLSDTSLKIVIDFSDFGGYNWCEIIRAVVKIATLVTCISLTLGSWAAAFGYNPKNDA